MKFIRRIIGGFTRKNNTQPSKQEKLTWMQELPENAQCIRLMHHNGAIVGGAVANNRHVDTSHFHNIKYVNFQRMYKPAAVFRSIINDYEIAIITFNMNAQEVFEWFNSKNIVLDNVIYEVLYREIQRSQKEGEYDGSGL